MPAVCPGGGVRRNNDLLQGVMRVARRFITRIMRVAIGADSDQTPSYKIAWKALLG